MRKAPILIALVLFLVLAGVAAAKPPEGAGAGKALFYNTGEGSSNFNCWDGATNLNYGPYGFAVLNTNGTGDLIVEVALKGAAANATYLIAVKQWPGGCPSDFLQVGEVETNGNGNGNAHVEVDRLAGATKFFVVARLGDLRLRTTAVALD